MNCPKCGSSHVATERRPDGYNLCAACHHKWKSPKPSPPDPPEMEIYRLMNEIAALHKFIARIETKLSAGTWAGHQGALEEIWEFRKKKNE